MNLCRKPRGFTLIELLVTISIVSLLASVVLASLNAAREKGRIGSARYFAAQVDHIAGDQAVAMWDFDECAGSAVSDRSGSGANSVIPNTLMWTPADTPNNAGCSLTFDGIDQSMNGLGTVHEGTGAFWLKLLTIPPSGNSRAFFNIGSQGTNARFYIQLAPISGNIILAADATWNTTSYVPRVGKWVHVVYVKKAGKQSLYIDGVLYGTYTYSPVAVVTGTAPFGSLGGDMNGYLNFRIDSVHVFAKDLTAREVGKLYASESAKKAFATKE